MKPKKRKKELKQKPKRKDGTKDENEMN